MSRLLGGVLYEGPSRLDGSPIVSIITGFSKSKNRKTGAMLQVWIMRADVDPAAAIKQNLDDAVCGSCPQRRNLGGMCYVVVEQAPLAIFRAWQRNRYEDWRKSFPANILQGRSVRFGAYGDPAAVPVSVWNRVRSQKLSTWTGYTHQWRDHLELRPFLMASVDSHEEMQEAQGAGWRTFRVRDEQEPVVMAHEVICPSDRVTCASCGLCKGRAKVAKSVAIVVHGYLLGRKSRPLPLAV